jgi:CDP-diacylglycerol--glycerol-3-phosphate 3-phosphatidyltransferase
MSPERGSATIALIFFILALLSDWLDGAVARVFRQVTSVGALMDALIDKIFVLGLYFYFIEVRLIPSWGLIPVLLILSREFIITGLRQCALLKHQVLGAESHGKLKTVLQFFSLFLLILVPVLQRDGNNTPVVLALADFFKFLGRISFAFASIMTIASGLYYLFRYRQYFSSQPKTEVEA